jgi:hypothetical protein
MTHASVARALFAIAFGLVLTSCVFTSNPVITSESDSVALKKRFTDQMRDLELTTGKRYKGKSIHINSPVPAIYRDWRLMPVAKIRGRRQGGLTSWRSSAGHTSVSLASWRGTTPEWLIRHEALHAVLLSHGITGHPSRYASLFTKSYWWMPEAYYREKAKNQKTKKATSRPMVRTVFRRPKGGQEAEITAACCPICGVDLESLTGH